MCYSLLSFQKAQLFLKKYFFLKINRTIITNYTYTSVPTDARLVGTTDNEFADKNVKKNIFTTVFNLHICYYQRLLMHTSIKTVR